MPPSGGYAATLQSSGGFLSVGGALMIAPFGRLSFSFAVLIVGLVASTRQAAAQTSVDFVEDDRFRYQVTKRVVPRAVTKTEWVEQQQTVYRDRYDTQWQTNYRTVLTPVTEYRQELYLANRWNPLATPYWTYRYVPVTRWEARQEPYSVPIAQRTWVPEQQTVRIPQTTTQMATEEHVSKVVIGPATSGGTVGTTPQTAVARQETLGGVKQFK
jgi:hypothetical protein